MANEAKATYPKIPKLSWEKLREQFKKTLPSTATDSYIASVLEIKQNSARRTILPTLRSIGLIDNEGKPTDLAVKWRDDNQYQEVCESMRRKIYPSELIDLGYNNISQRDQIQSWFANHTLVGESAARQMTSFYLLLCEADPNTAPLNKVNQSKNQKTKTKANGQGEHSSTNKSQDLPDLQNSNQANQENSGPELHFNIQIHISPDSTVDQIDAVFASMAKHLGSLNQR